MQALQWKKFLGKKVKVTANDLKPEAVAGINENCQLNGCDFQDYPETIQSEAVIETSCKNANLLLHERSFQYMWVSIGEVTSYHFYLDFGMF